MDNIVYLIFRRMRFPLLFLVIAYSTAMLGMVLIPGRDPDGNIWHMDFFHAFYFVSYMATTIGFGEIPYEFSPAQRLWTIFFIYVTVIVWLYSIGTVLSLVQDPGFRQAVTERRFFRAVQRIRRPFYLICGYGDTGSALLRSLTDRFQRAVVIDIDQQRINLLCLENHNEYIPSLVADASLPMHLQEGGVENRYCAGVVALTNENDVNLRVAITSKLLNPSLKVICRADSHDIEANMASFGTDYIVDPFDSFADHLAIAIHSPCLHLLYVWLTGHHRAALNEPIYPPKGRWVICGFGRFGKAVYRRLIYEGLDVTIIEARPEKTGIPESSYVVGRGTEAVTLREADIASAVAIVAGTDDDSNNLSIIMTARQLNPNLFVVARQNLNYNQKLFEAIHADILMQPSTIIANKVRSLLAIPLLYTFMRKARHQRLDWVCALISRIAAIVNERVPEVWQFQVSQDESYALFNRLTEENPVRVKHLLREPRNRDDGLPAMVLLLVRDTTEYLLPDPEMELHVDDQLLLCGTESSINRMQWTLHNHQALTYVVSGHAMPQTYAWKQLRRWLGRLRKSARGLRGWR